MYLTLMLLISAAITFFIASRITQFFLAERPEVKWVVFASLGSVLIAMITFIGLNFIVAGIDLSAADPSQTLTKRHPTVMFIITISIMLLLSSVAFKVINKMGWGSAIVTNIASVAVMLVASVGSVTLNDNKISSEIEIAKIVPSEEVLVKGDSIVKLVKP